MKKLNLRRLILFILFAMTASCGGGGGGGGSSEVNIDNTPGDGPTVIAKAGGDQIGSILIPITLDGSASSTKGTGELTYLWEFVTRPLGSATELSTSTSVKTSFTPDIPGTYLVKLMVKSGGFSSVPDSVTVKAFVPTANAGLNKVVSTGLTATLDGSGSQYGGGGELFYNWAVTSKPPGSSASIFDPSVVNPTFTPDINGLYVISLMVSNGVVNSEIDTVTIKATTVPVAQAGPDQLVSTGTLVNLDGRGSSTSDGASLTYRWTLMSKPINSAASLSDGSAVRSTITPDVEGTYIIDLVVNNGSENSTEDTVIITASPPIANAGVDQQISTGETTTLDGSGSRDPSGAKLTLAWAFVSKPIGSGTTLSDPGAINPVFTADVEGVYVIGLTVNNVIEDSEEDLVTVAASSPVAMAGADQKVSTGTTVNLDGSGSSDVNGNPITYRWTMETRPIGSVTALNDQTAIKPAFIADVDGTYEISLVVNNGTINSVKDTVSVISTTAPVANAGVDQSVSVLEGVTLDGNGSSDSHGAALIYRWTLKSIPTNSGVDLTGVLTASPTFTSDVAGDYIFGLIVNNGTEDSQEDTIKVRSVLPVANGGPDKNVVPGTAIILDGRGSSDVNAYPLTFDWSITSSPIGSLASLSNTVAETPAITMDLEGHYEVSLIINNGFVNSVEDLIIINVRKSIGNNSGVFSTDFEIVDNNNLWSVESGVWGVGTPTSGPEVAYIGNNVFGTVLDGRYLKGASARLISPSIILPVVGVGQEIQLSFQHWFSLAIRSCGVAGTSWSTVDKGKIEVSTLNDQGTWDAWDPVSEVSGESQGWTRVSIDLTKYGGRKIRVGLLLVDDVCRWSGGGESTGWYVDEFLLKVVNK